MGSNSSKIANEVMEDYVDLTYLNRSDILCIQKKFSSLGSNYLDGRFPVRAVVEVFPELKVNPFLDRLFKVFSSMTDRHLSFEDMLDLFSILSEDCPDKVKAVWAFKVFDFDDDNALSLEDIKRTIDRLTGPKTDQHHVDLNDNEKNEIALLVLREIDMDKTGEITKLEFIHAVLKMPDFSSCFCLKP